MNSPEYLANWRTNNPLKMILNNAKHRAIRKGWEYNITENDILPLPTHCSVLGLELDYTYGNKKLQQPNSPSINRIDSTKGYISGNIELISWRANDLMRNGTLDEFKAIVKHKQRHISL